MYIQRFTERRVEPCLCASNPKVRGAFLFYSNIQIKELILVVKLRGECFVKKNERRYKNGV